MITYRRGDEVFFKGKDPNNAKDQRVRKGVVTRLHSKSEQLGIRYEEGITKVWVCLEDVEILKLT